MNERFAHLPSPAMIVACVALVISLGGVSYAAGVLPRNSVGAKQLRRHAVKPAKLAPRTIALLKGQKGDPGPKGDPGATGATGPTGPAGPFPGTLPSEKTLRGHYATYDVAASSGTARREAISFGYALEAAPKAHFIAQGASDPACPGFASRPEAEPGHLCVYEDVETGNAVTQVLKADRYGALLQSESIAAGLFGSNGTWAVTAP